MQFVYDDGGRAAAGFKGKTGDCCARAIAIATGKPYQEVYNALNEFAKRERTGKRKRSVSNARTGVYTTTARKYLASIGWYWLSKMDIGTGCTCHLNAAELPKGRIIVRLSKHYAAVIDGVLHDTYDSSATGDIGETINGVATWRKAPDRCVYGYWVAPGA